MGLFDCCRENDLKKMHNTLSNDETGSDEVQAVVMSSGFEATNDAGRLRSYHSTDSENYAGNVEEEEETLRGVSNVVYRKEYVQSVYSFTSEQLGVGATGPIRTVVKRATGEKFAMKTINMVGFSASQRERLIQEILILGRLHHPNIVKLYEVYETSNAMYLIMELLAGGELYSRLINTPTGKFSEDYAKSIIKEVLNAISYLHESKNIAHRDLKLANIMFTNNSPDAEIKLIDFGLSKIVNGAEYMHSLVGTRYYIAPEVYMNDYKGMGYNKSCDMWSIGIITYFLLTGHNPLPPQMADTPFQEIKIDKIPFPKRYWGELSDEAKSFVQGLLSIDPVKRLSALEAQDHPWFKSMGFQQPKTLPSSIISSMRAFQSYNHLHKAALTAVAYHMNNNDLMKLDDAFEYFDKHNNGVITFEEFRYAMLTLQEKETHNIENTLFAITTDEDKLRQLFNDLDFEDCGYINYSEFVAACLARKEGLRREYAELIFQLIDRDHEGFISIENLHLFFGDDITVEEIEAYIHQTFGCRKEKLSEADLEMIMNTKMITNYHTEEMVTKQSGWEMSHPDASYLSVSSIFSRIQSTGMTPDTSVIDNPELCTASLVQTHQSSSTSGSSNKIASDPGTTKDDDELFRRSTALSVVDSLASKSYSGSVSNKMNMSFGSLPLPE